jgi:Mycothiol maleylpyruvate isomerase N-terminal domain
MAAPVLTRARAIRILETGQAQIRTLIDELAPRARTTPGLGGGDWSPKDLVGHLASWEEYALEALDAWDAGRGPAIDKYLWSSSTNAINRDAVARKARWSTPEVIRRADATHAELMARLHAMSDTRWRRPGTVRGRKPVGVRLGGILAGRRGEPFTHANAHLKDLKSFVAERRG